MKRPTNSPPHEVLEYLNSLEPRKRRDAALGMLDATFDFLMCVGEETDRNVTLAANLLRPQARQDGEIWRTVPLPKALEDEAHIAVGHVLWEAAERLTDQDPKGALPLAFILRTLADCFHPKKKTRRQARVRNRGKDYEADWVRDQSTAALVAKLRKTVGGKRAIPEAAALIGRSTKAVKEARRRHAQKLKEHRRTGLSRLRRHKTF